jgi:molybdate transport system substrate-binding protein
MLKRLSILATAAFASALMFLGAAKSAEIKVMISGGMTAAYRELVPEFERTTGNKVVTAFGPSMGTTENALPVRLSRGEPADVLIMVGYALEDLAREGKVVAGSQVALVRSPMGIAVRAGTPKPDISSVDTLRHSLLAAKSVAYSDSASGVYVETELFSRLGIVDQMKGKGRMIPAEPVGEVVARGEAEIGFQQISELKPVPGIDIVGPLPPDVQQITVFSAGIASGAREPAAGQALIRFLTSRAAAPVLISSGLSPITADQEK